MIREFVLASGEKVTLRIEDITKADDGFFEATFTICWPGKADRTMRSFGIDELDALFNVVRLAEILLTSRAAYKRGELTWNGAKDLGLILSFASRTRDLLA